MHAKHLEKWAAVRLAAAARWAATTVEVRAHCTAVSCPQIVHPVANGNDLDTKLMPKDSRIREERLITMKRVVIGATDAYPSDAHDGFQRPGLTHVQKRTRA
jgi:hypothetical protein